MLIFDMRKVGNRLYEIRKIKGMTQSSFAEKAGLSDRTYADIERGTTNMRTETLLRICDAMEITPNDIFTEKEEKPAVLKEEIIKKLDLCEKKELEAIIELINVFMKYNTKITRL